MDKTRYVKNELRNTEIYYKEIYGYKLKKQKLEIDQANLRSPSLSNSGGQHNGSSNFDLLDYTDEIDTLGQLIQLYFQKIRWNVMIIENAPTKLRTIITAVYVNGVSYDELTKTLNQKKTTMANIISDYFKNNISDAQVKQSIEISEKIKKTQKQYYKIIRQRKQSRIEES